MTSLLRLSCFRAREVERIASDMVLKPFRHRPAVFAVERDRDIHQLALAMGDVDGAHSARIDARPHAMGMQPAMLLMKDDGARLADESELLLGAVNRVFEFGDRDLGLGRRVQRQREQVFLALRALRDGCALGKGAGEIARHETLDGMHRHMVVVAPVQQMPRKLCAEPALVAF
ncbi:hypothetical protein ABMA59_19750 [Mesorhizobium sp. CN2-181]